MKLTDEKIAELAPDWATHYSHNVTTLTFSNTEKAVITDFNGVYQCSEHDNEIGFTEEDKPILGKIFDISVHEFSDAAKDCGVEFRAPAWVYPDVEINVKGVAGGDNTSVLMKEHAIALAKHFKLTADDLK